MDGLARAQAGLASGPAQNGYHYLRASWCVSWEIPSSLRQGRGMAMGSGCLQHPTAREREREEVPQCLAPGGED